MPKATVREPNRPNPIPNDGISFDVPRYRARDSERRLAALIHGWFEFVFSSAEAEQERRRLEQTGFSAVVALATICIRGYEESFCPEVVARAHASGCEHLFQGRERDLFEMHATLFMRDTYGFEIGNEVGALLLQDRLQTELLTEFDHPTYGGPGALFQVNSAIQEELAREYTIFLTGSGLEGPPERDQLILLAKEFYKTRASAPYYDAYCKKYRAMADSTGVLEYFQPHELTYFRIGCSNIFQDMYGLDFAESVVPEDIPRLDPPRGLATRIYTEGLRDAHHPSGEGWQTETMRRFVGVLLACALLAGCSTGSSGDRIAFASDRNGDYEIFVMNADGANVHRLTNSDRTNDWCPSWSPDGDRIAFGSGRDGGSKIFVMNADGTDMHRLTNSDHRDSDPSWSPDGDRIVFTSHRDDGHQIFVMNADGTDVRQLTDDDAGGFQIPSWSPDGKRIVFWTDRPAWNGYRDIGVMNADGTDVRQLTDDDDIGGSQMPSWSPDGKRIVFTSNRDYRGWEIYVMNADGTDAHQLTDDTDYEFHPSWSPDGDRIVFENTRDGDSEIFVMNADGTNTYSTGQQGSCPSFGG